MKFIKARRKLKLILGNG